MKPVKLSDILIPAFGTIEAVDRWCEQRQAKTKRRTGNRRQLEFEFEGNRTHGEETGSGASIDGGGSAG